jgi:hypothetical protein
VWGVGRGGGDWQAWMELRPCAGREVPAWERWELAAIGGGIVMVWRRLVWVMLGVGLLVTVAATGGVGASAAADFEAVMKDCVKISPDANRATALLWVPSAYWWAYASTDPAVTAADAEACVKLLQPYTLVAVSDGTVDDSGSASYFTVAKVRAETRLRASDGTLYAPLADSTLGPGVRTLLSYMRKAVGNGSDDMHLMLFPARDRKGKPIAGDPAKPGRFTVLVGKQEYTWTLPLKSLAPSQVCPTCGKRLDPAYKYCPWDGTKLGAG